MRLLPALVLLLVLASAVACSATDDPVLAEPSVSPTPSASATPTPTPHSTPGPTPYNAPYPAGSVGYAVSWPQCGAVLPEAPYDFGIVGITDGQAFTRNPCFAELYRWAEDGHFEPAIYMN